MAQKVARTQRAIGRDVNRHAEHHFSHPRGTRIPRPSASLIWDPGAGDLLAEIDFRKGLIAHSSESTEKGRGSATHDVVGADTFAVSVATFVSIHAFSFNMYHFNSSENTFPSSMDDLPRSHFLGRSRLEQNCGAVRA